MDGLSPHQEQELLAALAELETSLAESIDRARESARPVTLDQQAVGRLSRMEALQSQQLADANVRNLEGRLRLVRQALTAAAAGDYGLCRECEEPIGYRRLSARPESALCVACQGSSERR